MSFTQPITFRPFLMERVWGGRGLSEKLGRWLPPGALIGESWELVDRETEQSVVANGAPDGTTLHDLWTRHHREVFGDMVESPRFPLLAKILDARETLSVQVHPPASVAAELGGEPKSEMWYVLDATADASLFAGFRNGTTRADFERSLADGSVGELLHCIPVRAGDAIYIPSGRCHAIGAGCLLIEIQQSSDTTYRAFDWNRPGLDGRPRALHIDESLRSIDFSDHEPALARQSGEEIVACDHFRTERWKLGSPRDTGGFGIFVVLDGVVKCGGARFVRGDFFIAPAAASALRLEPEGHAEVMRVLPRASS
jgi:mannose-6-phosphate isomerase